MDLISQQLMLHYKGPIPALEVSYKTDVHSNIKTPMHYYINKLSLPVSVIGGGRQLDGYTALGPLGREAGGVESVYKRWVWLQIISVVIIVKQ